jgi:hypothetical protein
MAAMSLDDWLKSQNAYYLDGGYEPDQAYKQLWAGPYDQYKRQADLDAFGGRQTYSGKAFNPIFPDSVGWANVGVQGGGGIQYSTQNPSEDDRPYLRYFAPNGTMPFLGEQDGGLGYYSGDEEDRVWNLLRDTSGNPITKQSLGLDKTYGYDSYENAKNTFSSGYVPWNIDNVSEGLSNRHPFNLNALWGGTQYAQGRVTDWNHLDPTQYQANYIAANTRNELWNEYDRLTAQGVRPAKNPDEVALDFYVKNVGQNGNQFGYGPGANTALITEAVKHQFLNSPDVIQARGTTYQTPQGKMADIDAFGTAHQAGVPTWQVFEKQGYSSGFNIGSLIPAIIGAVALGPMSAAFAGTLGAAGGAALAGALIGGVTTEIGGGDFLKGALTGGVTSGLGSALSGGLGATASNPIYDISPVPAGIVESGASGLSGAALEASNLSSGMSAALVSEGLPKPIADALVKATTVAVKTGLAGGDIGQAVLGSLVNSGVGAGVSEGLSGADVPKDIAKAITSIATPVISTAIQGGDVSAALTNTLIKGGFNLASNTINEAINTANQNSRDVEAQAGGYYGGAAPTTIAPPVVAGNDLSPVKYADASGLGGTRIDVVGSPYYKESEGAETLDIPNGMRLASYDELNKLIDSGGSASVLPDGTMAFIVPDESPPPTSTEAPVIAPEVQENTQSPESLFVDQAINNIVNPPTEPPVGGQTQNFLPPLEAVNNTPDQSMVNDQISNLTALQQQEISDRIAQGESLEQALANVKTGLTDQLTGVQTGLTNQFQTGLENLGSQFSNELTGVQQGFQTQFDQLSDAQKDQALALLSQGQSLEQAISSVQTGLTEQIGDVRTGLTEQITGLESNFQAQFDQLNDAQKDQALALLSQGQSLESAIDSVKTELTGQLQTGINELDTKINSYIQSGIDRDTATQLAIDDLSYDVTQSNEDINRQLSELGLETGNRFEGVNNQITNLSGDINSLEANINAYMQSGLTRDQAMQMAIDDLGNDFTQSNEDINRQLTELGLNTGTQFEDVNTQINSLQTNINAYMQSGIDRDTATRMAIDDLSEDVTQSNEDINRQLTELGLDTGTQFEEVNNQISNLGGTLANYGGTLSGLLGTVSGLGGTVSGLSQNVATGQAQTQRQLEGINYQNTMEKLGKILAEPNQKYDSPLKSYLQPSFVNSGQAQPSQEKDYSQIIGELASVLGKRGYKVGGEVRHEDNPVEFIPGPEDRYYARHMKRGFAVNGPGTGQSDDIPTMLADGEYVIDADTVAALGDGSSKAGAQALDKFRENIRAHKRSAPTDKIPPKAKSPLEYLKMAQKPKGSKHG